MAWRLRFSKAERFVVCTSLERTASLEQPCSTREEFNDRMIALGDVLGALSIPVSFFEAEPGSDKWRSLRKLRAALLKHVSDDVLRTRAIDAVDHLRKANDLRVGTAHGGSTARADAEKAARALGIVLYPGDSWDNSWDQLRARVTEALGVISAALREPEGAM
jgi:hypothetical protein